MVTKTLRKLARWLISSTAKPPTQSGHGRSRPIQGCRYLLIMNRPRAGFFSSFIQVLGELHYCEKNDITPLVFFGNNWVYWQRGGYRGSRNGWAYYFEPVSSISLQDLIGLDEQYLESCNIFDFEEKNIIPNKNPEHVYDLSRCGHIKIPDNITVVNKWPEFHLGTRSFLEENREEANRLIGRFIKIHEDIVTKVNAFYSSHMKGEFVIGVHFRGVEHRLEVEQWHNLEFATEDRYSDEIDKVLGSHPDAKIFIATETEATLNYFLDQYGDRCVYYNSHRSPGESSPHIEFGGAEIGDEILIEALLLSKTDIFIHGISNVAFAVLALNVQLSHVDVYRNA
jgi:hypothetical protein